MWNCVSKQSLKKITAVCVAVFMIIGAIFYALQNQGGLPGGGIALVKLCWLFLVIFCWFIIPLLLLFDCLSPLLKVAISVFLSSMVLRAVVELVMMFGTHNWHPHYGIGHDVLMVLLSLFLGFFVFKQSRLIAIYLFVMAILFTIESGFAWYMLHNVQSKTGVIFYVPADQAHQKILTVTLIIVIALLAYIMFFIRKWLYGASFKS